MSATVDLDTLMRAYWAASQSLRGRNHVSRATAAASQGAAVPPARDAKNATSDLPSEAFVTRAMGAYASAPTGIAISDFQMENRGHYEALSDDQQATLRQAEAARRKELEAGAG